MKIQLIDKSNEELLTCLHRLQIESYSVEAQLIGSSEIPPLKETLRELREAQEVFWGLFIDHQLQGAISVETSFDILVVSKLVISPSAFRRGYGRKLVEHILNEYRNRLIKVSTASQNTPARHLYEKLGFVWQSEQSTPEGIRIVHYMKDLRV
jgi:ribosomal protein S18 acetylase RimI-like enzyme